jgi:hypothetical protein
MPHNLLSLLLDPRTWFAFGILFFGGFVLVGEISQRRENKMPPSSESKSDSDDTSE